MTDSAQGTAPPHGTARRTGAPEPAWTVLRSGRGTRAPTRVPRLRTVLLQVAGSAVVVAVAVGLVGGLISRRTAESESVHEAAQLTDVLAESVVQPALTDAMATDPNATAALNGLIRKHVLSKSLVRVKIWSPQGRILYSDEPRLVGKQFGLDEDARDALRRTEVRAQVSDLDEPENRYERGQGTLLEVHRPIWTPGGHPLLFESYFRYDQVRERAGQLWRGFAGITLSSIAAVVVLLLPIAWTLLSRARRARDQREAMLRRSMDAQADERRRIAATLHDGVVQELVAASFVVAGSAQDARARDEPGLADRLGEAGDAIRAGIGGLRSLLVDIYPPNLHEAGLPSALRDFANTQRVVVHVDVDERAAADLTREQTEAAFRIAQECVRNAVTHSGAGVVHVALRREPDAVVLEVRDAGAGFDPASRPSGHFGLALMSDLADDVEAQLRVRTAPGAGTAWQLRIPA